MNEEANTVLVTGASRGLGLAISKRLSEEGYRVIGIARSFPNEFPGITIESDLSVSDKADETFRRIANKYSVTRLINNVGNVVPDRIGQLEWCQVAAILEFNLRNTVQASQAVLPCMQRRKFGRIVNISSMTVLGYPGRTSYSASKAAIGSFTRTWALELAKTGITVNAIAPGPIETELFRVNSPKGSDGEARYLSAVPMARLGTPTEIAAAASYFMSEDAGYVTGQTLFIDGGSSIGVTHS